MMMNNTITRLQPLDVDVPLSLKGRYSLREMLVSVRDISLLQARLVAIPVLLALFPAQSAWAQDSATIEYPENAMHAVTTYAAVDPEGDVTPSWSLSGVDAAVFSIEGGVLTFKSPPDFEVTKDADNDNIYSVNVVASDGANSSMKTVTVEVTNVEEAGMVTLSALQPQAGTQLTATLTDPDDNIRETTWQWAMSASMDGSYTDIAAGATSAVYTPTDDDDNYYLRAMASYTDDEGSDKTAMVVSDYPVQRIHGTNHPPVFPTPAVSIDVEENTAAGRALGRPIIATDRNGDVLTYTLADDADSNQFGIDRATGQLKTKEGLNFEAAVDADMDNSYTVMVKATDPAGIPGTDVSNTATKAVTITVTDVNEAPTVTVTDEMMTFPERTDTTTVGIDTIILGNYEATDPEADTVVEPSWQVGGPDGSKFAITAATPAVLTFKADPNFEAPGDADKNNVYEVTVSVADNNGNRGTKGLKVTVTDTDEAGTIVLSKIQPRIGLAVKATLSDPDGNLSGITWEWWKAPVGTTLTFDDNNNVVDSDPNDDLLKQIENANSDTYTPIPEDFEGNFGETDTNRFLIAIAKYTDGHGEKKSAVILSTVAVLQDTRNRMPAFVDQDDETDGLQNKYTERVVAEDGTVVGRAVTATDPDPNADDLTYMLGGADAALFTVSQPSEMSMGGLIEVAGKLDYETRTTYSVTVTATDSFGGSSSIMVTIMVTDVNEPPEIMLGEAANVEYPENAMHAVATYTAVDPDGDAILAWSLSGDDAAVFSIEGGVLTFKSPPNFEVPKKTYSVNVVVSDGPNTAMKAVTVKVTNVDEDGMVTLSALQPESGTALTATVTDDDSLPADSADDVADTMATTWQWAKSLSMSGSFANIANATSETYSPIDDDENYYLKATASYTDNEGADKTAMGVSDNAVQRKKGDDTRPEFPSDPATVALNLNENTAPGRALGPPISAKDSDGDILTYTIVVDSEDTEAAHGASFAIDRATGQLMTKTQLDFEADSPSDQIYLVTVKATDPGGIPTAPHAVITDNEDTPEDESAATASAIRRVQITVLNVNEAPTVDGSPEGDLTFDEVTDDIADALATYTATDPEEVTVEDGTWQVGGPDGGKFAVSTTGELRFKAAPNFEAPGDADKDNVYEVTVSAADPDGKRGARGVMVTVMDEDEGGTVTLSKIQPRVGIAVMATLSDPDGNLSGITWEWWSATAAAAANIPSDAEVFAVTDGTPIVDALADTYAPVKNDLFDDNNVAQVLIAVAKYTDGDGAGKFAYAASENPVLEDTRNRMPMFADQDYDADGVQNELTERTVAEDGSVVGRVVMARDPDPNVDTLTYMLGGADAALFEVDSNGQIRVSGKLDYETRTTYSVTVTATDSFGDSSSIMVAIMVTDVNEPPVIFLGGLAISGSSSVDYAENGMDAVDTYMAVGPGAASADWTLGGADADNFSIDDGVLTFNATPDHEAPADANMNNVYVVRVKADDGTYSDTHDVTVIVTDVDEVVLRDYGPEEEIVGMPTGDWTPDLLSRATHEIVGSAPATVTFEHGGRIEEEGITYTCLSSGGCTIEGIGVVTGMVQASMTPDESDLVRAGKGELKNPGTMFMDHTYNGFELRGSTVTLRSVAGEVTRLSFLDINGDVIFVDFSSDSSDTEVVVTLEDYMDPLDGSPYNQPDSWYAQGLATVTVVNPTEVTWLTVTSIGNDETLVDPAIVMEETFMTANGTANGWAEIRAIVIEGMEGMEGMGSIGAIHAANVSFRGDMTGVIGIDAMDTVVMMVLSIGDIAPMGMEMPYLRISGDSLAAGDMVIEEILIHGGDLALAEAPDALQIDTGGQIFKIMAVDGMGTIDAMLVPAATGTFVTDPDDYFLTDGQMIVMEEVEMPSN